MRRIRTTIVFCAAIFSANILLAQEETTPLAAPDTNVINTDQWKKVDASVKRALTWLASQQQPDGSFSSTDIGQPGITSFCLMAFLAQGESPANGQYQQELEEAIDFIVDQQKANGLISTRAPDGVPIPRNVEHYRIGAPSVYNHAISALALSEAYGQCNTDQAKRIGPVIDKAIAATLEMQGWGPKQKWAEGGWRYLDTKFGLDADLSVTGWQLMFLRSAKNAGFEVPQKSIEAAVKYIEGCFLKDKDRQVFVYMAGVRKASTRAMAGAGVLAMAHAGRHGSKEALASGEWILKHDFKEYNKDTPIYGAHWAPDRYHYGCFLCTQAMFHLGGKYWEQFFPPVVETLLTNQQADGSWPPEKYDKQFGNCYSTALCILCLSAPNQMLPILQR